MEAVIREYRPSDRESIKSCIKELQKYVSDLDTLKRTRDLPAFNGDAYIDCTLKRVEKCSGNIFVAEEDGRIAGCIVGISAEQNEIDSLESYPSKSGSILELIVTSEHRKSGLGTRLMQAMEEYFRTQGCTCAFVDCFAPNISAHEFYVRAGYIDRMHLMLKLLS